MATKQHVSSGETYFSQHGEDFLLSKLFKNKREGFFVEIGCIDGLRFSNSLYFEKRGWRGLCVEAHSDYIQALKANRKNSLIEFAAVGEQDRESVKFYANSRGSLSSLDKNREEQFKSYGEYFTGFEVQLVPMLTLNTIFKKHRIGKIDFISLDIEGYEVQALKGLDLAVYRPAVFVIESDSEEHRKEVESILLPKGYYYITSIRQNLFYSLEKGDRDMIDDKVFRDVSLTHTEHPLDSTGNVAMIVDVKTGSFNS